MKEPYISPSVHQMGGGDDMQPIAPLLAALYVVIVAADKYGSIRVSCYQK
ncbi:hypothetical protein [Candidatus Contubernalis alkaliaceticus]|nr:hypothetical protein [Candidatus Contubernalis alkalaceticus]UNC92155.1 hypothetical protein HUE98_08645 [Candidatus Contubernalis alkalaceticus]